MRCYNCGGRLSEHDFCTGCGADVALYKRILMTSNRFYNDGLAKANVRDLSGAIGSLRQSLKFNKNNIEARNLLGLVYFETGEVVAALSEWVISKNLRPGKNIADTYIEMVQSNAARLDSINQTIKKYNQALAYCQQDSMDLAVIQLKKVLSLNPRFVRAHQLLALLYINMEEWEKAKRELDKCLLIDRGNTMTLRYKKEVDRMLASDETVKNPGKKKSEEAIRYQSDNEIIIQPINVKEPKTTMGTSTVINILLGIVLGVLATYFLIRPGILQSAQSRAQEESRVFGEQLDAKTAQIADLEQQIANLTEENNSLHGQLDSYVGTDGTLQTFDSLLDAARGYIENPSELEAVAQALETIKENTELSETSEAFQNLYQALLDAIGPGISAGYYTTGYQYYSNGDYAAAIKDLEKAVFYDPKNGDALFALGNSYRRNGDEDKAKETYNQVIELLPGSERARRSQAYLDEMNAE